MGVEHDVRRELPGHASAEVLAGVPDQRLSAQELGDRGEFDALAVEHHLMQRTADLIDSSISVQQACYRHRGARIGTANSADAGGMP